MPAAGAIATVGVGLIQANKQKKAAESAANSQAAASSSDLEFRKAQYQKWVDEYETPLVKPLIQKASGEGPLNLGPAWANIQQNFDASGRNLEAAYARSGMTGSGLNRSGFATLESARAGSLGDAFQKGLQNRDNLRMSLANFGKGMPESATNLQQGYGNTAALYGDRANQAALSAVGAGLGSLGSAWGKYGARGMFGLGAGTAETPPVASAPYSATATQARLYDNPGYSQAPPAASPFAAYQPYAVPGSLGSAFRQPAYPNQAGAYTTPDF
jgi:hypothetical protein